MLRNYIVEVAMVGCNEYPQVTIIIEEIYFYIHYGSLILRAGNIDSPSNIVNIRCASMNI